MNRRLIYLFPCLMDISVAIVLFASPTILAHDYQSPVEVVAAVLGVWGLFYMISGYVLGHFVTEKNAVNILLASCAFFVASSVGFALAEGVVAIYVMTALFGIINAGFFVPFQVFMKRVDQGNGRSVCYSAAFYTFSWSIGIAIGRYVAGYLAQEFGWVVCFGGIAPPAIVTAIGILFFKRYVKAQPDVEAHQVQQTKKRVIDYEIMPDLAWMGWLFAGLGITGIAVIGSVFPKVADVLEIKLIYQGSAMFVLFLVQGLVAFSLRNGKTWMYQPKPMLGFACVGTAGMLLFGMARDALTFHIAAGLFGIFAGANFVYFVFHALVHPLRSAKYVSINETVVGLTGVVGPLLGGVIAYAIALNAPFYMMAGVMLIASIVQVVLHAKNNDKVVDMLAAHGD